MHGELVRAEDVLEALPSPDGSERQASRTFREARAAFEKRFLTEALRANNWNVSATAKQLDLNRSYLHTKLRTHGISLEGRRE